jgi:hypothetical protein
MEFRARVLGKGTVQVKTDFQEKAQFLTKIEFRARVLGNEIVSSKD